VPIRELPDWLVRVFAHFNADLSQITNELNKKKYVSNEKAKRVLGWATDDLMLHRRPSRDDASCVELRAPEKP
jgi:hypothetical protein